MTERIKSITRNTLVPVSIVAVLLTAACYASAAWSLRCRDIRVNTEAIEQNRQEIRDLRDDLDYLRRAMVRVETKLGTLPPDRRK